MKKRERKRRKKMEYEAPLDSLATVNGWAQGSPTRPFISIVSLYMAQQMDVNSAVEEIVSVLNVKYQLGDMNIIGEYLTDLWHTTLHTSKKTPHKDLSSPQPDQPTPTQSHLLTLLRTLKTQPPPPAIPQKHPPPPTQPSALVWADLPLFAQSVRSALRDAPGLGRCGFSEAEAAGWENFTAFVALVARDVLPPSPLEYSGGGAGSGSAGLEGVAVRMIRLALEERHDGGSSVYEDGAGVDGDAAVDAEILLGGAASAAAAAATTTTSAGGGTADESRRASQVIPTYEKADEVTKLNVYVACAALWAIIMGEELWERKGDKVGSVVGITVTTGNRRQSLFREGIPLRRWEMWTNRLEFLSRRGDLRIETRELAAEGAAVMRRVL
ncbi:uncharacterized protein BDW47DRAFT_96281 [Aspergillus candidus]|uniref:Uncharacterized protein n=1 Tax=Aspergillus candidus TaxID=41067 RepID=A0A2I2EY94_ASPCN|nr:hypothetical protein BDW47DRAFT_96281 [Aspergillus candidus]PLB33349.1 hypothetical protein BDW47DRAFT_96281 [Aspergillus candidus]